MLPKTAHLYEDKLNQCNGNLDKAWTLYLRALLQNAPKQVQQHITSGTAVLLAAFLSWVKGSPVSEADAAACMFWLSTSPPNLAKFAELDLHPWMWTHPITPSTVRQAEEKVAWAGAIAHVNKALALATSEPTGKHQAEVAAMKSELLKKLKG